MNNKTTMLSESETKRQQMLAGIIKESHDGSFGYEGSLGDGVDDNNSDKEDERLYNSGKQEYKNYIESIISKEELDNDYEGHYGGYNLAGGHKRLDSFFNKMSELVPRFEELNDPLYDISKEIEKERFLYKDDILTSAAELDKFNGDYIKLIKKSMGLGTL